MPCLPRLLCLPIFFAATVSHGATPYEGDLPIELARYFTGDGVWYSGLPDDFPPFTLPAGLQVLGTLDQTQRKQIIVTTTLERGPAQEALVEAITAEGGWIRGPTPPEMAFKPKGFVEKGRTEIRPILQPVRLCHDTQGRVQLDARSDAVVYMSFSGVPRGRGLNCSQQNEMERQMVMAPNTSTVEPHMPVIELPDGMPTLGNRALNVDGPVAQTEIETGVRLNTLQQSPGKLSRNFTRQMRRQGWKRDRQWSGELSAGSSWTRQTEDNRELSAFLSIVRVAENEYELNLRLQALD